MSIAAHEEALAKLLDEEVPTTMVIEVTAPAKPQFYVHIDKKQQTIVAISPQQLADTANADVISVEIDYDLAEKFLLGVENVTRWVVVLRDDKYGIMHEVEFQREKAERVNDLQVFEITTPADKLAYPDIVIEVGAVDDAVLIHYNGATVPNWSRPAKLYFTAEGDPGHLKCAFTLDVNTLSEIAGQNNLAEWPNPIVLNLNNAHDISVYSIRSGIKMAIKRHEASNY